MISMKIYDALKIAIQTLENSNLMHKPEYKLYASKENDKWVFWFVFLPETPGLDVTAIVATDGTTEVLAGI